MSTKTLNTRIQTKIDTLQNWKDSTLPLLPGEIAIATEAVEIADGLTEPVCIIRIGEDGKKTFSQLPDALHAKAIDVLPICKNSDALKEFILTTLASSDLSTTVATLLESLNVEDEASANKYISSVNQVNGLISITREEFPNFLSDLTIELEDVTTDTENNIVKKCIVLKDAKKDIISYIDATDFIKDGMLNSAVYNAETHKITLNWNTDAGINSTDINLEGLVDAYTAGEGISIEDGIVTLSEDTWLLLGMAESSITEITSNGSSSDIPGGLIINKDNKTRICNIAIDDSITFIFNCGGAEVTA